MNKYTSGPSKYFIRNLKLDLEYDGSRYHGWQYQPNQRTIQEVIEETTYRITNERSRIIGAGRTDAGVHAHGQVANFYTQSNLDVLAFQRAMNSLLPEDIVIKMVTEVPLHFHARRNAIKKRYEYWILNSPISSVFCHRYSWHIRFPLDTEIMRKASQYFLGEQDFSSFRASGCECGVSAIRTISHVDFKVYPDGRIRFGVEANAFLRFMVRTMIGTLVEVGRGKIEEVEIPSILQARDRKKAGRTAPANALFLKWILYP